MFTAAKNTAINTVKAATINNVAKREGAVSEGVVGV
jgi:hypothetical protein